MPFVIRGTCKLCEFASGYYNSLPSGCEPVSIFCEYHAPIEEARLREEATKEKTEPIVRTEFEVYWSTHGGGTGDADSARSAWEEQANQFEEKITEKCVICFEVAGTKKRSCHNPYVPNYCSNCYKAHHDAWEDVRPPHPLDAGSSAGAASASKDKAPDQTGASSSADGKRKWTR